MYRKHGWYLMHSMTNIWNDITLDAQNSAADVKTDRRL